MFFRLNTLFFWGGGIGPTTTTTEDQMQGRQLESTSNNWGFAKWDDYLVLFFGAYWLHLHANQRCLTIFQDAVNDGIAGVHWYWRVWIRCRQQVWQKGNNNTLKLHSLPLVRRMWSPLQLHSRSRRNQGLISANSPVVKKDTHTFTHIIYTSLFICTSLTTSN